jgi:hypothetical protein
LLAARRWRRNRSPICSTVIGVARILKGASIAGGALQKRLFASLKLSVTENMR